MTEIELFDYKVASINIDEYSHKQGHKLINTINAYSYVMAEDNIEFKKALQSSDILLPDGFPIVTAAKLLKKQSISKIAGADIHKYFLELAQQDGLKVFYLGSSDTTLSLIKERITNEYPAIKCSSYSPPYKPQFSDKDNVAMINAVNDFAPDVLFVGMTAPKQEIWAAKHKDLLNASVICCIGAVFDFYAGTVKRAPRYMIAMKLEWFYRLIMEPKRMWRRYLIYSPKFAFYMLKAFLRK